MRPADGLVVGSREVTTRLKTVSPRLNFAGWPGDVTLFLQGHPSYWIQARRSSASRFFSQLRSFFNATVLFALMGHERFMFLKVMGCDEVPIGERPECRNTQGSGECFFGQQVLQKNNAHFPSRKCRTPPSSEHEEGPRRIGNSASAFPRACVKGLGWTAVAAADLDKVPQKVRRGYCLRLV